MRNLKALTALLAALILALAAGAALAADKAQVLKEGAEKMEALICEAEGYAMAKKVGLFKEAGLAYQPSLTVPVTGVIACKNKEQLRILFGMYTFDSNYALLFGKKKEFAAAQALLRKDIPEKLKLADKLKVKGMTADELKKVAEAPDDPANRELFLKYAMANIHDLIAKSAKDPAVMDLMVDSFYGAAIQGLYVSCKLALGAGVGEKLVALFNEQASRLDKANQLVEAYAGDKELAALVEKDERQPVLKPILALLKEKKGNLAEADVKKILALIEPERKALVKACK
ncbi:MAG: hypothetical protein ACOZHQ_02145 [Thermodesulfobacteriota bacterium]